MSLSCRRRDILSAEEVSLRMMGMVDEPRLLLLRDFWVYSTAGDFLPSSVGGCPAGPTDGSEGVVGVVGVEGVGKMGGVCRAVRNQKKALVVSVAVGWTPLSYNC